ncbi:helix-turn-helix domain-containing protein [Nitrosospira multiformis]|nr:helix-turn-helix domain-containing protein [Nitrosospira multiformis]
MKGLGDNGEDEGKVLRRQIEEFLESLGESCLCWAFEGCLEPLPSTVLFARAGPARHGQFDRVCDPDRSPSQALCPGSASLHAVPVLHSQQSLRSSSSGVCSPSFGVCSSGDSSERKPWPATAAYGAGYPHTHTDGYSKVTIDNSQAAAGANRTKLAKEFGISRETLYQYIR